MLQSAPTINELREIPVIKDASFLKSGPATTVQSISFEQAIALIRLVHERNPELEPVWQDVDLNVYGSIIPDLDMTVSGREGQKRLVHHRLRERDRGLVDLKKRAVLKAGGRLICEVCSFSFEDFYSPRGQEFCEVHHLVPLSELEADTETRLEDLAILCSNCHRMIHQQPWMEIEELKRIIRKHSVTANLLTVSFQHNESSHR